MTTYTAHGRIPTDAASVPADVVPNGATRELAMPAHRVALAHSETVQTRSRKGRTSYRVVGARAHHAPILTDDSGLVGLTGGQLARWADSLDGVPALLGQEDRPMAFAQVISVSSTPAYVLHDGVSQDCPAVIAESARRAAAAAERKRNPAPVKRCPQHGQRCPVLALNGSPIPADDTYGIHSGASVARHHADLAGGWGNTLPRSFAPTAERHHGGLSWPTRMRISRSRRRDEVDEVTMLVAENEDGTTAIGRLVHCIGWSDDPSLVWRGHRLTPRTVTRPTSGRSRKGRARSAQQLAHVADITPRRQYTHAETIAGALMQASEASPSVVITLENVGTLTLTPQSSGMTKWHLQRADNTETTGRARSVGAICARVETSA